MSEYVYLSVIVPDYDKGLSLAQELARTPVFEDRNICWSSATVLKHWDNKQDIITADTRSGAEIEDFQNKLADLAKRHDVTFEIEIDDEDSGETDLYYIGPRASIMKFDDAVGRIESAIDALRLAWQALHSEFVEEARTLLFRHNLEMLEERIRSSE